MREMKDSGIEWVGAMPKGWELRRAKTLFTQRNSKGNEIEVLLSPTQKYGVVPQSQLEGVVQVKEDTDLQMFKTVHKGDFVISLRSFQGGFEYSLYEGVCSPAYQVFYPTSPICDTYYRYLFKSQSFISKMNNLTVGIREGKNIQYVDFANSQIPVPPLAEQERIAAFLDAECAEIDAVLEKTRASIEEYKKLKQAVITQAVTKGVRGDRPMKDSGIEWIGEIPAEWDILNLVAHTSMLTPMRDRPENLDGPIPWVRIEDFEGKYIESSKAGLGVSMKTVKEMNLKVYPVGTILCTSSCIMGKCAIVSRELVSNQRFIGIIPDRTTDKTYLYYLMTSNAERMNFLSTGALQANLSRSAFEHLKVQFPPYSEQQEIAAYLDDKCEKIDELILKKQQYLTEIENYKKSLIYEYVTGKKEVLPL